MGLLCQIASHGMACGLLVVRIRSQGKAMLYEKSDTFRVRSFSDCYKDILNTDFPVLLSDDEFEDARQQRKPQARSEHERWDNRDRALRRRQWKI
jgi:hypothetical protein